MTKVCRACSAPKPLDAFAWVATRGTHMVACRDCVRQRCRGYRATRADHPRPRTYAERPRRNVDQPLFAAAKSRDEEKRPLCPCCNQRSPRLQGVEWLLPWGHRCPHGDPCPGWLQELPHGVDVCATCNPQLKRSPPRSVPVAAPRREESPRQRRMNVGKLELTRDRLRRILNAAHGLLEERGTVFVMDLASRAKVGTQTVYHYFASMDELREALADERSIDAIIEDVEPGLTTVGAEKSA